MENAPLEKYIDVESALGRLAGNRKLLDTLLKKFANESFLEQLNNEVAAKDFAAAAKTAHTIKGVASNLSMTGLHGLIVELEQQLKNNSCDEGTFNSTVTVYTETVAAINQSA